MPEFPHCSCKDPALLYPHPEPSFDESCIAVHRWNEICTTIEKEGKDLKGGLTFRDLTIVCSCCLGYYFDEDAAFGFREELILAMMLCAGSKGDVAELEGFVRSLLEREEERDREGEVEELKKEIEGLLRGREELEGEKERKRKGREERG